MIAFADYQAFSNVEVPESDFPKLENRAVLLLSSLCGQAWNPDSDICKRAVLEQIEFIQLRGGITGWATGGGSVGGHSWSVGGESESYTYTQSSRAEGVRYFNGLAISPLAWALLKANGLLKESKGVRVW